MKVYSEQQLVDAVNRGEHFLEIEGDLASGVIAIRGVGLRQWLLIFAALMSVLAVRCLARQPAPPFAIVSMLGFAHTSTLIKLCWLSGGAGILTALRNYRQVRRGSRVLVIRKY